MGEVEGDVKVLQALDDVPVQSAGIGHHFHAGQHLGAFQGHAAGHDQADVAAAQDHNPLAGQIAFHVDIALGGAGGEHARRTSAGDGDGAPGALPAAHSQHDGLGLLHAVAGGLAYHMYLALRGHLQHHGIQPHFHAGLRQQVGKTGGVLRPAEFFLKILQAKAAVDALVQDAAQLLVTLDDQDLFQALFPGGAGRRQTGGAAADR